MRFRVDEKKEKAFQKERLIRIKAQRQENTKSVGGGAINYGRNDETQGRKTKLGCISVSLRILRFQDYSQSNLEVYSLLN